MSSRMTDEIVVTKSNYDDFSMPSPWRNFEVIADNRALYVNAGWLAELSNFFAHYCFGVQEREPYIADGIKYDHLLEFFRCIFYCPQRKQITVHNVSMVMELATKYDMRPVLARCENLIAYTANSLDRHKLFQVTCAVSHCDPNSSTMTLLVDRLSSMKQQELDQMNFHEMPGEVVAEVYSNKMQKKNRRKRLCCIM